MPINISQSYKNRLLELSGLPVMQISVPGKKPQMKTLNHVLTESEQNNDDGFTFDEKGPWFLKKEGKTIATALVSIDKNKFTFNKSKLKILYIMSLLVYEKHRNKGVGTLLMKNIINRAKNEGYGFITLVTEKNNVAAMKLYHKFGFKFYEPFSSGIAYLYLEL